MLHKHLEPEKNLPLHDAIRKGDLKQVKILVEKPEHLYAIDEKGQTPLHLAIIMHGYNPELIFVTVLLNDRLKRNLNAQDNDGNTPLRLAIIRPSLMELLLQEGANANLCDNRKQAPIHRANRQGLQLLLKQHDINLNIQDNYGNTSLHIAAENGHKEIVTLLLNSGADYTLTNYLHRTPYMEAREGNKHEVTNIIAAFQSNQFKQKQIDSQRITALEKQVEEQQIQLKKIAQQLEVLTKQNQNDNTKGQESSKAHSPNMFQQTRRSSF